MAYLYDDEDNAPMNEQNFDQDGHNPTVYASYAEMKADEEPLPFTDQPEKPADGCWNCMNYDWTHEACTTNWNNMDESYYNPDCDDRRPTDWCEDHETNPEAEWDDWFDEKV